MDILEKIDSLGWSVYKLAEEAILTQSTLAILFNRRSLPSIPTLELICEAFGMTLAEFFADEKVVDTKMSNNFNKLTEHDKEIVNSLIDIMCEKK